MTRTPRRHPDLTPAGAALPRSVRLACLVGAAVVLASGCTSGLDVYDAPDAMEAVLTAASGPTLQGIVACAHASDATGGHLLSVRFVNTANGAVETGTWAVGEDVSAPSKVWAIDETARQFTTWGHLDITVTTSEELEHCLDQQMGDPRP